MPLRLLRQIIRIGTISEAPPVPGPAHGASDGAAAIATHEAHALQAEILALLGRALAIRQVDAGSCNGCELEIQALNNPYYNIEGMGIRFVASPRHADLLLVTGPVSAHMEAALRRTYDAVPAPKRVVAVGECGCNGGVFGESYASRGRVANVIPVDVEVGGCPPTPVDLLRAIFTALTASPA
ncbi:subunit of formate hydrogenlyase-like membrane complex [Burkholderiales bacterium GJ-E10]|nr:subunit of formate hydrogenlyase-like membrane complex [Burkholderiales bacterium GJ-E10]